MVGKNIASNYVSRLYVILASMLVFPILLGILGPEEFGLIGIYTLIMAWMALVDFGLSPTLSREISRHQHANSGNQELVLTFRTIETLFFSVAVLTAILLVQFRGFVSSEWLNVNTRTIELAESAFVYISLILVFRLMSSLYRSSVVAFEHQVWVSFADILLCTLRHPGSVIFLSATSSGIESYFTYQLVISIIEFLVIRKKSIALMPGYSECPKRFSFTELRRVSPFALGMAYTSIIWVLITQYDKLLLSKILTLEHFGYFSLIIMLTNGMNMLSTPVFNAVLPRFTRQIADGQIADALSLYRGATRLVVSVVAPVTLLAILFPEEILFAWTGNQSASEWGSQYLSIFVVGSGILALVRFQYIMIYAYGRVKYSVVWNTIVAVISIPAITIAAYSYGILAIAWIWLIFRLISLLLWVPWVHSKFAPGLNIKWFSRDLLVPIFTATLPAYLINTRTDLMETDDRLFLFAILVLISLASFFCAAIAAFSREIYAFFFASD